MTGPATALGSDNTAFEDSLEAGLAVWDGGALAIPVAPLPGEGLPELIVRATAENSYGRCATIPNAVGIGWNLPAGLSTRIRGKEPGLANLLGVPYGASSLEALLYLPAAGPPGWQSFFGTSIRRVYRDARRRRVSPRALAASPHLRAIWTLRVLPFDPYTKETLLDRCPVCKEEFGWTRTRGVVFCDQCMRMDSQGYERGTVDLRDYPQPLVDERHWTKLDFLTGLVDPDPSVRASFAPVLPETMRDFERGELFEFTIALASAFEDPGGTTWGYLARHAKTDRHKRLTPEVLAIAATAVLDWPKTFNFAVEQARNEEAARPGHFGRRKAFGAFAQLAVDQFIHPRFRALAHSEIEKHFVAPRTLLPRTEESGRKLVDLTPIQTAGETLGISKNRIARLVKSRKVSSIRTADACKASILVSVQELAAVVASDAELVPLERAAARLDIPALAVRSLCANGLLESGVDYEGKPVLQAVARRSLGALISSLDDRVIRSAPPVRAMSLKAAAVHLCSPAANPWPNLLLAILQGRLKAWQTNASGPTSSCIFVLLDEAKGQPISTSPWTDARCNPVVSHQDAARLLGTNVATLYVLLQAGKLPHKPRLAQLQAFAKDNALTGELVGILGLLGPAMHPRNVVRLLVDRGVRPITPPGSLKNRLAWPRAQAETVLAEISERWESISCRDGSDARDWCPELISVPKTSTTSWNASETIGVPRIAFPALSSLGLLSLSKSPNGRDFEVDTQSLDYLAGAIETRLLPPKTLRNAIPLARAAAIVGSPHTNPWPALVAAILDGSLPSMRTSTSNRPDSIAVALPLGANCSTLDWNENELTTRVTQADAARLLGTRSGNITALVRDGLLPRDPLLCDVQAFAKDFALTAEVCEMLRAKDRSLDPRLTVTLLRSSGIDPATVLTYQGALVWRRAEIKALRDAWYDTRPIAFCATGIASEAG